MKTIWIGADYPFCGQPWEVFGPNISGRPNIRFIAMITADRIPDGATIVYQDNACTIYRFWNIMFQVEQDTGEITVA